MRYWTSVANAVFTMNNSSTKTEFRTGKHTTVVALTGFMGSGKTTVGRELAARLGWEFVDLDAVIEASEQQTVREIFRTTGEAAFRALEHTALQTFLSETRTPTVLAMGGGAIVQAGNAALLQKPGVVTVFLDVPVEELLRRCSADELRSGENLRPLAGDEVSFQELHMRRLPAYRRADIVVDAAQKNPAEIAQAIADALRAWSRE
jgi:shikimate kinase